jgi:hypothetical protein
MGVMKIRREHAFHKEIEFSDSGTFITLLNDVNDIVTPVNVKKAQERKLVL